MARGDASSRHTQMKSIHDLMDLHGRVALITGGAGHIGFAIAESLAELGAGIAVLDMRNDDCDRASHQLGDTFGVQTLALAANLASEDELRSIPEKVGG